MKQHDVLIIGGGPGGSVLASFLAMRGIDVGLFEKEAFPRFHIGESLLPHSMDIFREVGVYDTLDSGKYLRKFGAVFLHHEEQGEVRFDFATGLDGKHPMAFEVPRAEFDKDLLMNAKKLGATVYQPETVKRVEQTGEGVIVATDRETYHARYLADATGRDAFLGKQKKIRFPNLDLNNVGVFTHFTGVRRLPGTFEGDIVIGMLPKQRWSWMIPFKGERTSAGVVCPSKELRETDDLESYLMDSLTACPAMAERMQEAIRVSEIGVISNYSHYCDTLVEGRAILVGDAASFLDPIFSSGVHMAVSMGKKASELIAEALATDAPLADNNRAERYTQFVRVGTHRFHRFIRMFYDSNFVGDMKKAHRLKNIRGAFTSVVAGDVWNEDNPLFRTEVFA